MIRLGPSLLLVLALSACVTATPGPDAGGAGQAQPPDGSADRVGRVGPDGAPPAPPAAIVERGIGGTGAPVSMAPAIQSADRGIGGTGIVGVVTGFGSVFVDGFEVEYDESSSVDIDGAASSVTALRAGQLVAIQADGSTLSPHARSISVRTAVSGRIEALELGTGTLTIAGQAVSVPAGTWGADRFGLGDWVSVSGLRRADGTIVASRLDAAPAGALLARGRVVREGDQAKVGNLALTGAAASSVRDGQYVVVSGSYAAGRGQVSTVAADPLWPSPAAYFGPAASQLYVQAFVWIENGAVSMNGVTVKSAPVVAAQARQDGIAAQARQGGSAGQARQDGVAGQVRQDGIAVVSLQRQADGSYTAVGLRYSDYKGHTDRPGRGGSGSGAGTGDTSQQPQRPVRTASTALPVPPASETASAPAAAAAAVSSDPYPVGGSTTTSDAITATPIAARTTGASVAGAATAGSAPAAGAGGATPTPVSVDSTPQKATPSSGVPISSTTPVSGPAAAASAMTPTGGGATGSITAGPNTAGGNSQPGNTAGGSGTGGGSGNAGGTIPQPTVQSVTSGLISSNTQTGNSAATSALAASVLNQQSGNSRSAAAGTSGSAVRGSSASAALSTLTTAVTSVTSTAGGSGATSATPAPTSTGKSSTTTGTNSGKSSGGRSK